MTNKKLQFWSFFIDKSKKRDRIKIMKRDIRPFRPKSAEARENIRKGVLKRNHEQESYILYSPVKFEFTIEYLKDYIEKFGNASVPTTYVCDDGYPLGKSVQIYRQKMRELEEKGSKRISAEKYNALKELGVSTERKDPYGPAIEAWEEYYQEHGYFYIPEDYFCPGIDLYGSVMRIMKMRREGRLSPDYSRKLDEMGVPKSWSQIKNDYKERLLKPEIYEKILKSLKVRNLGDE